MVRSTLTLPLKPSIWSMFFLRSANSCPATVHWRVAGGTSRSPGPMRSRLLAFGIYAWSTTSPGRRNGRSGGGSCGESAVAIVCELPCKTKDSVT